ncbi:GrpB family protein [Methyloligella solikamskensis]|uniref:GrpB family protein n=1 Tax=Methyloligella solikamskensis TaxID=1177756 RepID=A0ABW3JDA5_9HYPH
MCESPFRLADMEAAREAADRLFAETSESLRRVLPETAEIHHVGATAVPGCVTKGDLDIVVRVRLPDFAAADRVLSARYARNSGSIRTETFSAFEKPDASPALGIQLTAIGGEHDFFHLFVSRLLADPQLVSRYNALKRRFEGKPMEDYRAAKSDFIGQVLKASGDGGDPAKRGDS